MYESVEKENREDEALFLVILKKLERKIKREEFSLVEQISFGLKEFFKLTDGENQSELVILVRAKNSKNTSGETTSWSSRDGLIFSDEKGREGIVQLFF